MLNLLLLLQILTDDQDAHMGVRRPTAAAAATGRNTRLPLLLLAGMRPVHGLITDRPALARCMALRPTSLCGPHYPHHLLPQGDWWQPGLRKHLADEGLNFTNCKAACVPHTSPNFAVCCPTCCVWCSSNALSF